ncbi:MFS transporter [Pokkaliibacter sp. CJK22405]|uniref:MFS transporter n=1 Tax=Pokkaliibacter sp. CJK22405 TaxID=3384615 RepID=UPI0039849EDD
MDTNLFRHPTFLRFWISQIASSLAFQMLTVGIGWQMYSLTNSAMHLGMVGLAQFLPQLALTLVVGHVADQYNRRTILMICRIVMAATVAVLAWGSYTQHISAGMIYACAAALGASRAFEMPSSSALLPNLVPEALLSRALALVASAREATVIAGPAIGGVVYLVGPTTLYSISVLGFLLSSLILSSLQYQYTARAKAPVSMETLLGGIRFIRRNPVILGSISLDMFAVLLGGATALLPIVAKDILHTGPWGLGLLRCAPAVGAVLMSVYLARHPLQRKVGKIMFSAVAVFGLGTIVFGLSTQLWMALSALVIMGAADMVSVVIRSTLVQLETPDEMRGRVSAANSIFIGTSNQLGEFESGVTAALLGTVPAIVVGGFGTLVIVGLWMKLFPALTARNTLEKGEP